MTDELEAMFEAARILTDPAARQAFLDAACRDKPALRHELDQLLRAQAGADALFETGAPALDAAPGPVGDVAWADVTASVVTEQTGARIGRYNVLQKIGEGGCGVVYLAEQQEPVRRHVALKVIKLGMDTKSVVARFEAERQALALMDHSSIAKVLDGGATETGRPYFVMELVRGTRITRYCDDHQLSTRARLELFVHVCQAVQHAHQKGIIHRDLKPSNILVTVNDGNAVPKVIDFGIAKAIEQKLTDKTLFTAFDQIIGTPAYMSPEQAAMTDLDIDTRSDIYSLGVLLYELLTGHTPFDPKELLHAGAEEMCHTIRNKEPVKPSTRLSQQLLRSRGRKLEDAQTGNESAAPQNDALLDPNRTRSIARHQFKAQKERIQQLRGDLDWIVMKCLEKDRTRRYETANALATDIQRHLNNEPVLARPPSNLYRFQRLVRRNKFVFAAAAAIITALVAGIILSTWQAARARRAERTASTERDSAQAVLKFFRDRVLAAGRPEGQEGGLGKDVTLRKALDAAESRITHAFRDHPLQEAAIRDTLGTSYHYLGEPTLAVRQLERALALRRQHLGTNHPETLSSVDELGAAYHNAGQLDEAISLKEQTLQLRKASLGPEHPRTLDAMNNLAVSYQTAGRLDQALLVYQELFGLRKASLGPQHVETIRSMNNLATAYHAAGKLDQALPLFEEALALRKTTLGPDHADTMTSMHNLGGAYMTAGQLSKAQTLLEGTLQLQKAKLGPDHPATFRTMHNLALTYQKNAMLDLALPLFDETLMRQRARLKAAHPDTLTTMRSLALAYKAARKFDQALALLEEELTLRKARQRPDDPDTLKRMHDLGLVYEEAGKPDQALPVFEEIFTLQKIKLGPSHRDTLHTMDHLATAYQQTGKLDQAEAVYRQQLALQLGDPLANQFRLGRFLLDLAKNDPSDSIRAQEHAREGLQLMRDYLAGARNRYTNDPAKLEEKLYNLADLYSRRNDYAEAEPLYREVAERARTRLGPEHKEALDATASLARLLTDWAWATRASKSALRDTQNLSREAAAHAHDAEQLLRACLAIRSRDTNVNNWRLGDTKCRLGAALVSVAVTDGALDEAARLSRLTEAEALLLEGNEQLQRNPLAGSKHRRDALERLVHLYEAWSKEDKRSEWQQKLDAHERTELKPAAPRTSESQ